MFYRQHLLCVLYKVRGEAGNHDSYHCMWYSDNKLKKWRDHCMTVEVGQVVEDFTLPNQDGKSVSLSDFRGKNVVLYFYPKDMTPGCTNQACDFRDHHESFKEQ